MGAVASRPKRRFAFDAAARPLIATVIYAIAMAYVESAAVLYLRTIYGGVDPVGSRSSPFNPLPDFVGIEIGREAATMVMLAAVAYLAASTPTGRLGAFGVAMGTWDIFYYVFLWLFAGWPATPLAADILFLLPLPWWGPVLAPVLTALVIVIAGAAAMARECADGVPAPTRPAVAAITAGAALCLVAFMADALLALPHGLSQAFAVRGGPFPWPLFLVGVALGAIGLARALVIQRAA